MNKSSLSNFPANHTFAQTNIQLINQLTEHYTVAEIDTVVLAYDLACELFGSIYRGCGKPFLAHVVGTASVIAAQRAPIEVVCAGLLHAAYVDGKFGSKIGGNHVEHRRRVSDVAGKDAEALVLRYAEFSWRKPGVIPRIANNFDQLSSLDRQVLLLRLANELEEHLDLGLLYCDDFEHRAQFCHLFGDVVIELAAKLEQPELARLLGQAFATVRNLSVTPLQDEGGPEPGSDAQPARCDIDVEQSIPWNLSRLAPANPGGIALEDASGSLTCEELHAQSNHLALALLTHFGPTNEPVIALCGHNRAMLITALAAFKANKIWVPLDATHPAERLALIVTDSRAVCILHEGNLAQLANAVADPHQKLLNIEDELGNRQPVQTDWPVPTAESLACIVYTSGSTGAPKGVVHNQRNLLHLALRGSKALKIDSADRLTLLPSCSQIAGITDMLRGLLSGATLLLFDVRGNSMADLRNWLFTSCPTIYHSSPTLLRLLAEELTPEDSFTTVRMLHLGGEAVTQQDVSLFQTHFPTEARLVNNLGCSELSGYRQFFIEHDFVTDQQAIPAGYAVEGIDLSICDEAGKSLPSGLIGEITLTSEYLAVGYWQRPEESAAVFQTLTNGALKRRYRTGDLGYLLPDGCLVFAGRNDNEVQVRGNRVNAAEVEAVLASHPGVARAAVSASSAASKSLVAYIVADAAQPPGNRELRRFLQSSLPAYMTPHMVFVERLPETVNGKVSYTELTPANLVDLPVKVDLTREPSRTEAVLIRLWQEQLNVDTVGISDSFFELGGDSLLVIRLLRSIEGELEVRLTLREVFGCDTLADLATTVLASRMDDGLTDQQIKTLDSAMLAIEALSDQEVEAELKR